MEKDYKHTMEYCGDWKKNTGALGFKMNNDYLFRALLQSDEETLKYIIASAMGIDVREIRDILVTNPILLGDTIDDKELHLDVKTLVEYEKDKIKVINLEMQLVRHEGWIERSVQYVCRAFDSLVHGNKYAEACGVWQISFCDFTLFTESPAFLSDYMLINTKDIRQIYTDKIRISNINLKAINMATDEDRRSGLVLWARLFKAESWEELIMLANENPVVDQTVSSVWQLSQDRAIREQMQRREENEYFWESTLESMRRKVEEAEREAEERVKEAEKKAEETIKVAEKKAKETEKKAKEAVRKAVAEKNLEIEELKKKIRELENR